MEIIKNIKGGEKLCFEGFMYNKHISKETAIYWRCTKHNSGCKGRLSTSPTKENPRLLSHHNHPGDQRVVDVAKVRCDMKDKASRADSKPSQIIARASANAPVSSLALLPCNNTLRRTIQNETRPEVSEVDPQK